jgi:ribosomal-protein-alanine N-acetyltransferase
VEGSIGAANGVEKSSLINHRTVRTVVVESIVEHVVEPEVEHSRKYPLDPRLNIRALETHDVDAVLAIQSASPQIAQWTLWDYNRVAAGDMAGWVAEENSVVVGFLVARHIASDIEILNIAVAPDSRRHGIGASLFQAVIAWARFLSTESAFLEVRESNHAALRFYEQHDFRATGRRSRYYSSPPEDAVVLSLRLK